MKKRCLTGIFTVLIATWLISCNASLEKQFAHPPDEFKPMPFWHFNGEMTTEGIWKQMKDACELAGFSGISVLPPSPRRGKSPGTLPPFLTPEYFDRFQDVLVRESSGRTLKRRR